MMYSVNLKEFDQLIGPGDALSNVSEEPGKMAENKDYIQNG